MWRLSRPHPERLHLTEWPHPAEVAGALLFMAFGLYVGLFAISTGSEVVLRCHRLPDGSGICRLTEQGPNRQQDHRFDLPDVRLVVEDDVSDGEPISWLRVRAGGRSHFVNLYSGRQPHDKAMAVVARFEAFQAGHGGATFVARRDVRELTSAFGYGFALFGLLPAVFFSIRRTVVDRQMDRLTIRRWGLLPWTHLDVSLAEVQRIHIAETTDTEGDASYCLQVDLVSGRSVPLLKTRSTRPVQWEPLAQAIADAVVGSGR